MLAYIYVLESIKDASWYIGWTLDLRKRLGEHNKGQSYFTKRKMPYRLIYYEACLNRDDAQRREHYLKTTQGRKFLHLRLKLYLVARRRAA